MSSSSAEGIQADLSEGSATLHLDPRIYTRDAILRTSYWCSKVAYIHFPASIDGNFIVEIRLKYKTPSLENPSPISINAFIGEFCNTLLDFQLRHDVEIETAPIRELILAKAFSESGVLEEDPPGSIADPVENQKPSLVNIITKQE